MLLCWVIFAMAGFGFYKTTEDQPFSVAGHAHPLLRDAHVAVQAAAIIASAAVVLGALPLIAAALARARRDPHTRRTVALALAPVIAFVAVTLGFLAVARHQPTDHVSATGYAAAVVWMIAGPVCGVLCVLACRAALFATPVGPPRLRAALFSGTLVTAAMVVIAAASGMYAVALIIDAAGLAGEPNGPFHLVNVSASLIVQTIVMTGATVLAAVSTRRGWRVRHELTTT